MPKKIEEVKTFINQQNKTFSSYVKCLLDLPNMSAKTKIEKIKTFVEKQHKECINMKFKLGKKISK